jgi:putative transposase
MISVMAGIACTHYTPTWSSSRNIEERCLTETPSERLQAIFEKVCRDFQAQLVEMNGEAEHVRLLIHYPPKHSVSSLVNSLKGVSSRLLRIERPGMEKRYWHHALWSPSYFAASCGGAPLSIIKQYIEQQKTPL